MPWVGGLDCSFMKGWSRICESFSRCAGCWQNDLFQFQLKILHWSLHALNTKDTFFRRQFMRSLAPEDKKFGSSNSADTTLFSVLFTPSI